MKQISNKIPAAAYISGCCESEEEACFEVHYANGNWWKYYANGTWG
ncbi:hypothetical protein GI584_14450 [Gracilibacillus salitolerans]|uniref:Uncharacterized protein n=1 Tax=Gracilibacillus salitolerans TaxID=2663022 RepID=A0A5Q2TMF5_9BACI|nr:hypothetical protein [Gracilibacillus salitolerans]QGH35173.1 hypothetical protein GI584_14450 [Gracilibacillus salitolerans]